MWPNAFVTVLALVSALPSFVGQSLLAWLGLFFPDNGWERDNHGLGHYFLAPYMERSAAECGAADTSLSRYADRGNLGAKGMYHTGHFYGTNYEAKCHIFQNLSSI